jgi:hypothetical protein
METEETKIFNFDDAKTWDWSNPLTLRLIDGRHVNSLDRFTEILKYKIDKGSRLVEAPVSCFSRVGKHKWGRCLRFDYFGEGYLDSGSILKKAKEVFYSRLNYEVLGWSLRSD